jgi:DNA topoisomerase VI subunit B
MSARLERTTFSTSRLLDFASEKELIAQTGHQRDAWPVVLLKELVDNAIDAAEESGIAPVITVTVNRAGITVEDNGPGIPADVVEAILDFSIRVSSRKHMSAQRVARKATR